jgi:chaperone modulatory protein CbpM
MITFTAVLARLPGLDEQRLRVWIEQDWVRPARQGGELMFAEIDLARLHLILDLEQLEVGDGAMPVVLSLLDQLHTARRQMRLLVDALDEAAVQRLERRLESGRLETGR